MTKIYIAHPFGGQQENADRVQDIITDLVKRHPQSTYISPIHMFGYLYDEVSYEQGMSWCLNMLNTCDCLVLASDEWINSRGCNMEVDFAKDKGIVILTLDEFKEVLDLL